MWLGLVEAALVTGGFFWVLSRAGWSWGDRTGAGTPLHTTDVTAATMTGPRPRRPHHGTFGNDRFGILAERFARAFGTPRFIIGQSIVVAVWIALNAFAVIRHWDPYPFILLNLAFSTQAAYAAPLILLAQTRQAERDRIRDATVQEHRDAQVQQQEDFEARLLAAFGELTRALGTGDPAPGPVTRPGSGTDEMPEPEHPQI
jgi:uncharacterized membrane protein